MIKPRESEVFPSPEVSIQSMESNECRLRRWAEGIEILKRIESDEKDPVRKEQLMRIIAEAECM